MAEEIGLIQVPAQLIGMNPRADRSWRLQYETRELTGDEAALLANNFQGEGWLVFKPNGDISEEEVPEGLADSGTKSQSQRLRDVIFILWKQKGGKGDFETYYRTSLERLIEVVKEQLQEEK